MRNFWRLLFFAGVLFAFGCNGHETSGTAPIPVKGPYSAAGVWVGQRDGWRITLTKQPALESAVINPGLVEIVPDKRVEFEMKDGRFGYFVVGDCPVDFDPQTGLLTVEMYVKKLMIPVPDDKIEGWVRHVFTGIISEDGSTWDTTWYEYFDYGPRFPMAPEEYLGVPFKFYKKAE